MVQPFGMRGHKTLGVGLPLVSRPFGKRGLSGLEAPDQTASVSQTCEKLTCRQAGDTEPHLQGGENAVLSFYEASGLYVLTITARTSSYTVTTADEEVLPDQLIVHCAVRNGCPLWSSAQGHSANMDGHSLDDIECDLNLETLREHRFDRDRMAEVLGVSVRTIRNRIRGFRDEVADRGTAGVVPSCGSPP